MPLLSVSPEDILKDLGLDDLLVCHLPVEKNPLGLKTDISFHLLRDPFINIVAAKFFDLDRHFCGNAVQKKNLIILIRYAQALEQEFYFKLAIVLHQGSMGTIEFFQARFETNFTEILILVSNPKTTKQVLNNILEKPFNEFIRPFVVGRPAES